MRGLFRAPGDRSVAVAAAGSPTRLAWQANRLDPHQVVEPIQDRLTDIVVWRNPARERPAVGRQATPRRQYFDGHQPQPLVARRHASV